MLHKKKSAQPAKQSDREETTVKPAAAQTPDPPAAGSSAPAETPPAAAKIPLSQPRSVGRPPSTPHCLRCGRRIARCKCKDGSLLAPEVKKAAEEAKKRAGVRPMDKDEAEQLLRMFCWICGVAESAIAGLVTKLTWDEAEEIYSFSEQDIASLLPPAHRVLVKHAARIPQWLRDYRDELNLAMAFYNVEKSKVARANELIAAKVKTAAPQKSLAIVRASDVVKTEAVQ